MNKLFSLPVLVLSLIACEPNRSDNLANSIETEIFFEDTFSEDSQGEYVENIIQLPPPEGLGYTWKVLPGGHKPLKWIHSDELDSLNPKKGFWVIPTDSGYLEQGGRSHNSVLFAAKPIPENIENFDITFMQFRHDNDPIMYVLGAKEATWDQGWEFGYMIQVPETDSTTTNAYISGDLGEKIVEDAAFYQEWIEHKIEVRGKYVRWLSNDIIMIDGDVNQPVTGYFGIRQRYERGTRYDDVEILIYKQ